MLRRTLLLVALLLAVHLPLPAGAAPAVASATTEDRDADGRIDAVKLSFDAAIDERQLRLADLKVDGREVLAYEMPSTSILRLLVREAPGFDSGATPKVTYKVVGEDGTTATGTVTPDDGAAPVLVSVLAVVDSLKVRLRWSEPVRGEADDGIVASELDYDDINGEGAGDIASLQADADGAGHVLTLDSEVVGNDLGTDTVKSSLKVRDHAETPNTAALGSRSLSGPRVDAAVADIGSDLVRVFFNVPLASVPGDGSFDVVYDHEVSDPIGGVVSVATGGSPDELLVRLTDPVKQEDVRSLEPAFLAASPDRFTARGVEGGTIAFTPERAPLSDRTAPRVVADDDGPAVLTQDRDRDGLLDALLVRFSEPVVSTCSDGLSVELHQNGAVVTYELDHGPGQVPKPAGADNVLLVRLQERSTHEPDTGLVPDLVVRPCPESGQMPFEDLGEVARGDGSVRGNPVLPVRLATVQEEDGAPPVVLRATSQDRDNDGFLDAYVLEFSEPLVEGSFDASQWTVEGHTVTGGQWNEGDLILEFDEVEAGSSGDLPVVGYSGGGAQDLRDPSGNPLEPFTRGNFPYVDNAGPRIVRVFGDVGQTRLRVQFSEPVEGVDPETGGPGRNLKESDFFYDNRDGAGVAGIDRVEHTRGDTQAFLYLTGALAEGDLSDDGEGGDAVRALQGHIREANGDAAQDRALVGGEPVGLLRLDVDAPGSPGGADGAEGIDAELGVTKALLTFPAVPDDAGDATGSAATGYRVYVRDEPFPTDGTEASVEAIRAVGAWPHVTLADVPAVGAEQRLTVERLCPASPVHLAVEALDDFDNPSPPVVLNDLETLEDPSPAEGTLEAVSFRSASHPLRDGFAVESTRLDGSVTWSGFTDPETCGLEYFWVVDGNETRVLGDDDAARAVPVPEEGGAAEVVHNTTEQGARFDLAGVERPTTLYLHVAARSEGGFSPTFHYPLDLVLPVPCIPDNLLLPDVEAVRKDGVTTVSWGAYAEPLPPDVELKGYQVWLRPERGSQMLREELEAPADGFEQRRFLDDLRLRDGDGYYVTAYFTDDLCRFEWDADALSSGSDPGGPNATFAAVQANIIADPPAVPVWAWVTLTIIAMLVVGGLVLFFALRHQRLDESWLREDEDPHDPDNPFGEPMEADAADGDDGPADPFGGGRSDATGGLGPGALPSLTVTCPACTHRFRVQGQRPLAIVCPNCSASGTLE